MRKKAIVIGAGIVGLAISRSLAIRNYSVEVFDRNAYAIGASIRNFGMIWPVGQSEGKLFERAMISRSIWQEICELTNIWYSPAGSLHLAYTDLEWQVLESFYQNVKANRNYVLLNKRGTIEKSVSANPDKLIGGLYSPDEIIVDAPLAIPSLANWLNEKYSVKFHWKKFINQVDTGTVYTDDAIYKADEIYVCTGPDFENLFPSLYSEHLVTKCKLQMMKTVKQPNEWKLGPSLCGGLSLTHYPSFKAADQNSLSALINHFTSSMPNYVKWGIHVMIAQNSRGELVIGDSHEYGHTHDPFDKEKINKFILDYLYKFSKYPDQTISATWNGIYTKLLNGGSELILEPIPGVTIVNGLGGAGMTLSFGLAEHLFNTNV